MSVSVTHLLQEALLLPPESQTELIEALLERAEPSKEFVDHQLGIVSVRRTRVEQGSSIPIDVGEADDRVISALKIQA